MVWMMDFVECDPFSDISEREHRSTQSSLTFVPLFVFFKKCLSDVNLEVLSPTKEEWFPFVASVPTENCGSLDDHF